MLKIFPVYVLCSHAKNCVRKHTIATDTVFTVQNCDWIQETTTLKYLAHIWHFDYSSTCSALWTQARPRRGLRQKPVVHANCLLPIQTCLLTGGRILKFGIVFSGRIPKQKAHRQKSQNAQTTRKTYFPDCHSVHPYYSQKKRICYSQKVGFAQNPRAIV